MGSSLKWLLAGAVLGLMAVFAGIGVKSVLDDRSEGGVSQGQAQIVQSNESEAPAVVPQANNDGSQTRADTPSQGDGSTDLVPAQTQGQNAAQSQEQAENTDQADTTDQNNTQAQQVEQPSETDTSQSTQQENKLDMQLIDEYGGLQLTLIDPSASGQTARGRFIIRDAQDQVVADMKDIDTASFDLTPGFYEITVIARNKKSARMVEIVKGEFVTEHFNLPSQPPAQQQQANAQTGQQQTAQPQQQTQAAQTPPSANNGKLSVVVQTAGNNVPLKSNIYVQQPNGTLVTKQNYADFAAFDLQPGSYKVTVKAPGKSDIVRNVQIQAGQTAQQVFAMKSPAAQTQAAPPPPEGILRLLLASPPNARNPRRGRFIIQDSQGQRIKRMRGVSNAEVRLEPGKYKVIAVHRGQRLTKQINIAKDKVTNLVFKADEFPSPAQSQQQNQQAQQQQQVQVPARQGVLQLVAVSGVTRQPLKVDFMVSTLNGRRLKMAKNVSVTEVAMAPQDVLVDISYEEMRGQERIQVKAGEPTVYTFTISPNTSAPIDEMQQQAPRSLEEMLMERLQQELLNRLN